MLVEHFIAHWAARLAIAGLFIGGLAHTFRYHGII